MPDDKCSEYCSSWKPKTSALLGVLDYSLSQVVQMDPPSKFFESDLSSR